MESSTFFFAGGALPPDCPSYVERPADDELFNAILDAHLCYVLAAHDMGKSSLMARTAWRLQQRGVSTATVGLGTLSSGLGVEKAYLALIKRLRSELRLSVNPDKWWADRASYDVPERFLAFLRDAVLPKVDGPIAIFVDEIDAGLDPQLLNGFLAAVRSVYSLRTSDSTYHRLTFVLLGTASLADLIKDAGQAPPHLGRTIDLHEFTADEAQVLQRGLLSVCPDSAGEVFSRILHWTNGHPYLTQKLCLTAALVWYRHCTSKWVDELVQRAFLSPQSADPNLEFVKASIGASKRRRQLLRLYRAVYQGKPVGRAGQSLDARRLERLGLVRAENGGLKVRNEVYRLAIDLNWVRANPQTRQALQVAGIAALFVLLLAGVLAFFLVLRPGVRSPEAPALVTDFENASGSQERLNSLAGLLDLDGTEDEARRLFYEELSPADQLALFDPDALDPQGGTLLPVVKGLYGDPHLENNPQGNALLLAMAEALAQSEDGESSEEAELELEIQQWVKGREYYAQAEYDHALRAYNLAISMNDGNPGTYFDRGVSYVAQGQPDLALADWDTVLSLDESWQGRVQQALTGDSRLSAALSNEPADYPALLALLPTPTSAPVPSQASPTATAALASAPTQAAEPTRTLSPQPTDTPTVAPTDTPTAEPTSTPTPVPTNTRAPAPTAASSPVASATEGPTGTPSPTSAAPAGTFTLLSPLSVEDPTYGPTNFEWRWSGPLPPDVGFEVRVWKEGQPQAGVHNAVLDNTNGDITQDGDTYRLHTDISQAFSVQGHSDVYWWTVALVRINPSYADLGQQATPGRLRFEGSSPDTGGGDDGGGVGVE